MHRRLLAILLIVLATIPAAPAPAWAAGGTVTASDTTWTSGTWNVTQDVTLDDRVEVDGEVVLHLGANTTLTASKGIGVNGDNKLTIEGEGKLVATGTEVQLSAGGARNANAGIGGTIASSVSWWNNRTGTIIINGGVIEATGGSGEGNNGAAGIGTCNASAETGSVTINGGTVTANGGICAAGIGGGNGSNISVVINGGVVNAAGGSNAADIGGGNGTPNANKGDINVAINGGKITASGDRGIGGGWISKAVGSVNVTLGWTNATDRIQGKYSLNKDEGAGGGITFSKNFIKEGDASRTTVTEATLKGFGASDAIMPPAWIVTFDSEGGSNVDEQRMWTDDKATKPADPTRADYTFEYWYTDAAPSTAFDFANTAITADTTLHAKWKRITRKVSFDSNGGSGTMGDQTVNQNEATKLSANEFTWADHAFVEWNTEKDGSGTAYTDEQEVTIAADLALFAQWRAFPKVSFDANGGDGTMAQQTSDEASSVKLATNTFTYADHAFVEWNTAKDGSGTTYADGATITLDGDTTLYAQWRAFPVVSFDANGGKGTMDPQVSDETSSVMLEPNKFTRARYVFKGWNTKKDGKGTSYADGATVTLSGDTTLYAQWTYGLTTSVKVGKSAPKLTCSNLKAVAEKLVSDDEASQGAEVWLQITAKKKADVPASDAKLATAAATKLGATTKTWLDISLYKKVGGKDAVAITETSTALKLSIEVPSSLKKSGRTFYLVRVHDGKAASIANTKSTKLSAQSKLFSTYVIAHKDASSGSDKKNSNSSSNSSSSTSLAQTGDPNASLGTVGALALGGVALLAVGVWTRRRTE